LCGKIKEAVSKQFDTAQTVAKVTLTQTRKTPGEGFPLFRPFRTKNSPFLRFYDAQSNFDLCGGRPKTLSLETASL